MAWTTPKTWSSEVLTSTDLNTHVRDNLDHIKDRIDNLDTYEVGSAYSSTSTSFVDIDATNLALTITTNGGAVLVGFAGSAYNNSGDDSVRFDILLDGTSVSSGTGVANHTMGTAGSRTKNCSFVRLVDGVSAGSHTFKLQWARLGGATIAMEYTQSEPQFWVKEL